MNDEDWFVFYEKNIYCCYHILSKEYISHEKYQMSVFSYLLPIWAGGN